MLDDIVLNLAKSEFTISKINNQDYTLNIGNFCKHLNKNGMTLVEYTNAYYSSYMPICLESGEICMSKVKGYWNRYQPVNREFKHVLKTARLLRNTYRQIQQLEPDYYTDYITHEYWMNKGMKLSEANNILTFLLKTHKYIKLYRRLSLNFYDSTWSPRNRDLYISKLLSGQFEQLYTIIDRKAIDQRGNVNKDDVDEILRNRRTIFRDGSFQKEMNKRRQLKYPDCRLISPRSILYWQNKGYSDKEAKLKNAKYQDNNSVTAIMSRTGCDFQSAKTQQIEIYEKRRITFSHKPQSEIDDINKRKDSGSIGYFLRKYNDPEVARIKYNERIKIKCRPFAYGCASKESLGYFIPLYKQLRLNGILRDDIFFGVSGSKEYWLGDSTNYYLYDFTIRSKKIIIEYDGYYWHQHTKQRDIEKERFAVQMGFNLLRIDSRLSDKQKKLNINKFINENLQIKLTNW